MASKEYSGGLSSRGDRLRIDGGHKDFHEVLNNLYDTDTLPDGIVSLGLAENSLMHNELVQYVNDTFKISGHALSYGDGSSGSKRLRAAIARFVTRHFSPVLPVEAQHVHVSLGVTNANEMCAFLLGNSGDGFLLGRPFYGTFVPDFGARPGVETVGVSFGSIDPFSVEAVRIYEEALINSNSKGVQVKALVLCTPNNPLGRCYSRAVMIELMKLCQKYNIHFISDEIYALSVWNNAEATEAPTFTSALSIDTSGIIDPTLVHVLWGMSKDFGANGLRVGCIIDQYNPDFRKSLQQISLVNFPAAPSDHIAANVLENDAFTDSYIRTNRARIAENYVFSTCWLTGHGIPYYPGSNAGFFLWVDLRKPLAGTAAPYNHARLKAMLQKEKLFIADALGFGGEEEGWFRIVFTHPQEFLSMAFKRLLAALDGYKSSDGEQILT